eukprot:2152994-Pleurochrysis_carterae.AAC.1
MWTVNELTIIQKHARSPSRRRAEFAPTARLMPTASPRLLHYRAVPCRALPARQRSVTRYAAYWPSVLWLVTELSFCLDTNPTVLMPF